MSAPRVFISYSHKDKDLLALLVPQLRSLEQAGLLDLWVDTRIDAGDKWYPEIEAAMAGAAVAVCMVSEHFLASDFCTKEEVPYLLKLQVQTGMLIIPVLLSDCPWYAHRWVEERQMLPGEGQSVRTHYAQNPAAVFSRVAKRIYDKLNDPDFKLPAAVPAWPPLAPECVDLTRLPETGAALFGRAAELQILEDAWASADGGDQTRVLAFTAHGGVGKSTLVNHWLADMRRDNFRGATRVFGWTFFSQGARGQQASADTFIDAALRFFGDPDPTAGSPWDKGGRLARLVAAERSLLVLDGLEPLQSGHAFDRGKLRDPALETMLRALARKSAGLCLITTRVPVSDLDDMAGVTAPDLEQITPDAGRALLRTARVVGSNAELEALAARFGPHALAVSLLGVYLHETDPAHGIAGAGVLEALPGGAPLDRVLAGFERWLAGSPELEALRLLGFFDRPADAGCLASLRVEPPIPGLTDALAPVDGAAWQRALNRLEKLRLVQLQHREDGPPHVDAHPLLREHFAEQLESSNPEAWRAGHRRLYEHLKASVPHQPEGLAGLQPLYQAVAHGCRAGLYGEARDEVYRDRILRGTGNHGFYSVKKLGAFGADLGAVACFFQQPWTRLHPSLAEAAQAWLLSQAAFSLRALGRLAEALEPMRAGLERGVARGDWKNAAIRAGNLSELELSMGRVAEAVEDARQSVAHAERSGDAFLRMGNRTTLAEALHQAGWREEAQADLREAEAMQAEDQPQFPLLYSLQGFRYCDLLLAEAERAAWRGAGGGVEACLEVEERGRKLLEWRTASDPLLDIALEHLSLGRAALYRALLAPSDPGAARAEIEAAVDGLRAAGDMMYLPRGLLTRARLRAVQGDARPPEPTWTRPGRSPGGVP